MSEENTIPTIRFKGFSGDWNQCELGELLVITSASRVHKNEWTKSGVPFFRSSDVVADYKGLKNNKAFISFDLYEELSNKSGCVKKNDLLVTGGGSIGIPYLVKTNEPLYFKDADLLWLKNSNDINGYFLYTFFSTVYFRRYVNSITHIGTISHYTIEQAKSTPINVPDKKEQDKIGRFLTNLDTLITQHQQKHDKLLNVKKAMLEKILPKKGADVPEIRFKGFSDKWEKRSLGEVTDLLTGNPFESKKFIKEGVFLVRGMNVKRGYLDMSDGISEYWPSSYGLENYLLNENDILIQMDGALIGKSYAKVQSKNLPALLVQRVTRIRSEKVNCDFIYQYIQRDFLSYILTIKTETAVPHLSLNDIINFQIAIPISTEQTKIGNFFKNLDQLLTLHQTELEKLKNIKKACLEKMFI